MANDNFYGYKRDPKKVNTKSGMRGSVDLDFESINPYEFKKGMNAELAKMGTELRESDEAQREKATETVVKNLQKLPSYYSLMEHYETITRNMEGRKPTFNAFAKEMEGYKMKEIKEKFTIDKMKEISLKESIRAEVRSKIKEIFLYENKTDVDNSAGGSEKKIKPDVQRIINFIPKIDTKDEYIQLFTVLMKHKANVKPEIQPAVLLQTFRDLNT